MHEEPGTQLPMPHDLGHAQIKVVGVGGAGVNAIRRMVGAPIPGVELLCVNTDATSLELAHGIPTLVIGSKLTRGLGAGGNPEVGRRAAEESQAALEAELSNADLVFVAAGLGGGTGTGAAPIIAKIAKDHGAVVVTVVTTPFTFEGTKRRTRALAGMEPLACSSDTLLMVSNDRLLSSVQRNTSIRDSFTLADRVMVDAITALSRIINQPGEINIDFADVEAVVRGGGNGVMAIGSGTGTNRVQKAARAAIENPLMDISAHGAKGVIFTVNGGPDLTMSELNEAGEYISGIVDPDAQIFFGMHIDPNKGEDDPVEAILVATRLPNAGSQQAMPAMNLPDRVRPAVEKLREEAELPHFLQQLEANSWESPP